MSKVNLKSHPHCVFNLKFHLVLVTAYRRDAINRAILHDMEMTIRRICQMAGGSVTEFSGEVDHIHALIEVNPSITPSKLVNIIKTSTSCMIRRDHWHSIKHKLWGKRFWSRSYCLISVGDGATTDIIKRYIQGQNKPS